VHHLQTFSHPLGSTALSAGDTDVEVNTRIYKDLAYRANSNPRASPTTLGEGVDNTRVSPFAFTFGSLRHLTCSSHLCSFPWSRMCSQ
jgi:hypothetical protein